MPSHPTIYSGYIGENDGFSSPAPVIGPSGWTVFKSNQTEIYEVTHNLGLSHPKKQLHVVVQTMKNNVIADIQVDENSFIISTWLSDSGGSTNSDLMFIAAYYPKM